MFCCFLTCKLFHDHRDPRCERAIKRKKYLIQGSQLSLGILLTMKLAAYCAFDEVNYLNSVTFKVLPIIILSLPLSVVIMDSSGKQLKEPTPEEAARYKKLGGCLMLFTLSHAILLVDAVAGAAPQAVVLIVCVLVHLAIHRTVGELVLIAPSEDVSSGICGFCKRTPQAWDRVKAAAVLLLGITGYLYVFYCYAWGPAMGTMSLIVLVVCTVAFECSVAKLLIGAVMDVADQLTVAAVTAVALSGHLTLFREFLKSDEHSDDSGASLFVVHLINDSAVFLLWWRVVNPVPYKTQGSCWFSNCIRCGGRKRD